MKNHPTIAGLLMVSLVALPAGPAAAQSTRPVLDAQQQAQTDAAAHQRRIEALDDTTRALLEEYRRELEAGAGQQRRNDELRQLLRTREQALKDLQRKRDNLQRLRLELLPLLRQMGATLQRAVELDQPFLLDERRLRVESLQQTLAQASAPLPELLRRVLQAYLIETAYGYAVAVERGALHAGEGSATVDFLRLGRLALFHLSLDGSRAGAWDPASRSWRELDEAATRAVAEAIAIVRREAPPRLVELPLAVLP